MLSLLIRRKQRVMHQPRDLLQLRGSSATYWIGSGGFGRFLNCGNIFRLELLPFRVKQVLAIGSLPGNLPATL